MALRGRAKFACVYIRLAYVCLSERVSQTVALLLEVVVDVGGAHDECGSGSRVSRSLTVHSRLHEYAG